MHVEDEGRWVPMTAAAEELGVSVDTIKRRIKRGEVETRRESIPSGFRWLVRMAEPSSAPETGYASSEALGSPRSDVTPVHGSQVIPAIDHAMRVELAVLRQALDDRDATITTLQAEADALRRTVEQQAAAVAEQARTIASLSSAPPAPTSEGRGWWPRLRRWTSGG